MRPDVGVMHWSRREFLKAAGMSAAALVTPNWAFGQAPSKRPNFIFILMDDMGWMDTGCYGSQYYETPNINRLAAEGVRFTQAYAACPVCSPTRASILTGKYPARLRLTDWIAGHRRPYARLMPPDWTMFMPHEEVTIAEALKEAGYVTASVGKWHLGDKPYAPETQGFDHNIAGGPWGQPANYFSPYKREYPNLADGPAGEYLTDRLTDESLRFIAQSKDRPFFLYFPHYAVHTPIQAKQDLVAKYEAKEKRGQKNAAYAAMVESADESVGRILTKLDELRIADRTVIIFMSDNGGLASVTSNAPLRAGKGTAYEGGIREPMLIKWPGVTRQGSVCDTPVTSTDFYPTMLEMAGLPSRPQQHCDGLSLAPLLKQTGRIEREALFWHYPHYHLTTPFGAVRKGDWKLIEYYEDMRVELYNLKDDLSEQRDLAQSETWRVTELRQMLHAWRESVGAQMPLPNPNYDPARATETPGGKAKGKTRK